MGVAANTGVPAVTKYISHTWYSQTLSFVCGIISYCVAGIGAAQSYSILQSEIDFFLSGLNIQVGLDVKITLKQAVTEFCQAQV